MKLRLRRDKLFWYCLYLGALFYPQSIRTAFISSDLLKYINPFLIVAYFDALFMSRCQKKTFNIRINKRLIAVTALAGISLLSNMAGTGQLMGAVIVVLILVFPIVMIARYELFPLDIKMLQKGIKIFNIIIIIIIILGCINRMMGNFLNDFRWNVLSIDDSASNATRLWTIYGHPLYNTFLILAYFTLNYATRELVQKPVNTVYLVVTSLLGILLSASKAGILILIFLLLLLMFKNIRLFLAEVIAVLILNFTGMFDLITERFAGASFTSNRIENYILLRQMSFYRGYRLLYGYGTTYAMRIYNKVFAGASAAFEMPILGYSLDYGILYTVIFMGLTIAVPVVKFVKRKQWQLLFCYMAVTGYINTFNGIAIHGDYLGVYIFYVILMLKISDLIFSKKAVGRTQQ